MKGTLLNFDANANTGVISGDDGSRYNFAREQWKSSNPPVAGVRVDFLPFDGGASEIYQDVTTTAMSSGSSKKIPAALLAFFLGSLGIHKFYLGYNKEGLIMLLAFIFGFILLGIPSFVVWVIAFVEFIIYIMKSDQEFEQTYVTGRKPWF